MSHKPADIGQKDVDHISRANVRSKFKSRFASWASTNSCPISSDRQLTTATIHTIGAHSTTIPPQIINNKPHIYDPSNIQPRTQTRCLTPHASSGRKTTHATERLPSQYSLIRNALSTHSYANSFTDFSCYHSSGACHVYVVLFQCI